jgi:pimeloyl-ACP methyl ester carboxylesterase
MKKPYSTEGFERLERDVAGVRMVAYVAGSGPDVVYFHGGGTWHGFEFARDWLREFRVVLPYHPNYGESADAPSIVTLDDYVAHYRAFFEVLRLDSFHLVGASLGGRLATEIAAANANRLRSLVLVSPAGVSTPGVAEVEYAKIAPHEWPSYFTSTPQVASRWWPAEPGAQFLEARAREGQATGCALGSSVEAELRSSLQRIRVPTLLLWGQDDRMVPAGHAKTWQALIPGAKVEIIERAGHLLLDESAESRATAARFMREQERRQGVER